MKNLKYTLLILSFLYLLPTYSFSQSEKKVEELIKLMEQSIAKGTFNEQVQELLAFYDRNEKEIKEKKFEANAISLSKVFTSTQLGKNLFMNTHVERYNNKDGISKISLSHSFSNSQEYEPFKGSIYGISLEKGLNYDSFYEQLEGRSDLIVSEKKKKKLDNTEEVIISKKGLNYKTKFYFRNKKAHHIKDTQKQGKYLLSEISFYINRNDFIVAIEKEYQEYRYKMSPDIPKYTKMTEEYYAEILPKLLKGSELEGKTDFNTMSKLKSLFGTDNVQEIIEKAKQFPNYSYRKADNSSNRHYLTVFCFNLTIYNDFGVTANPKKVKSIEVRQSPFMKATYQKEITKELYAEYFGLPSVHRKKAQNPTFKGWYFMVGECITGDCENGWGTYKGDDFVYTGSFMKGQAYGQGKIEENGSIYEGIFRHGEYTGKGKLNGMEVKWGNGEIKLVEIPYEGGLFVGTVDENLKPSTGQLKITKENGIESTITYEDGLMREQQIFYPKNKTLIVKVVDGKFDFQNAVINYPDGITYKGEVHPETYLQHGKGQLSKETENLMFGCSYITSEEVNVIFSAEPVYKEVRNTLPFYIDAFYINDKLDYSKSVFFTQADRKLELKGTPNAQPNAEISINGTNLVTSYQNYEGKNLRIIGDWKDNQPIGTHKITYEGKDYTMFYDKNGVAKGIDLYAPNYKTGYLGDHEFLLTKTEKNQKGNIENQATNDQEAEERRKKEREKILKMNKDSTPLFADPQKKN